jgi:4-amino-4-deoxy-L-arabinose transferase-like glycosyltransferase
LVFWLLVRWIRLRDDRLLIAAGVVVGIAALTKFQVLLLCVVLLAAVAVLGPLELLRRPLLSVGAGIAASLAAPTLVWQYAHGWPQLQMAPVVAGEADALSGGRPGIAAMLIGYAGVAGVALVLYGMWQLFRDDELREYRFIGATFVVLYVLFVITAGRPYYLVGLYAPLAAVRIHPQRRAPPTPTARCRRLSATTRWCSASPTSSPRTSTVTRTFTSWRTPMAPTAATGTSRRRPPTMTMCSTSDVIPVRSARASPTYARSKTSATTCMRIC